MEKKQLPSAVDLEEAVVGAMLLEKQACAIGIKELEPEMFYDKKCAFIFNACKTLFKKGEPIDILTVTSFLRAKKKIDTVGIEFITGVTNRISSAANTEYHCFVIKEKYIAREIHKTTTLAAERAIDEGVDVLELLTEIGQKLILLTSNMGSKAKKLPEAISSTLKALEIAAQNSLNKNVKITGIPTGFNQLDDLTSGWQKKDYVIIGGRPSMGKTSMAMVHATVAASFGFKVYVQSYEMSTEGVTRTILSQLSRINRGDFKDGSALSNPFLNKTISKIEDYPITIDESSQNVIQLRAILTTVKMTDGLDMLVLDYLQLMPAAGKFGTTADEIGFNSRALKRIAKELDIVVIALAQLSRVVETRGGAKKPSLSDLKGSGDIEQDADIVLFPYRPSYYDATDDATGQPIPDNYAEYILAKQREGGLDDIPVGWDGSKTLYYDVSEPKVPETFEGLKPKNIIQPPDDGFLNFNDN